MQELNDEERIAIRLLTNQGRQPDRRRPGPHAELSARNVKRLDWSNEPSVSRRTRALLAFQAIDRNREWVVGGDLVVAVGTDDQQRSRIGIRENRVQQFERRSIDPLQVVEKDDEWMLGPGKGSDEAAEHVSKPVLRLDGLQRNGRSLFADDELNLRNDGRNDPAIRAKRSA